MRNKIVNLNLQRVLILGENKSFCLAKLERIGAWRSNANDKLLFC